MDLITTPWSKYGKKRLYVRTADGADVGYVDLLTGAVVTSAAGFEAELIEFSQQHAECVTAPEAAVVQVVPTMPPPFIVQPASEPRPTPLSIARFDLSANVAGAAARKKRDEVNAQAPLLNLAARMLGIKTDERAWRVGAKGEEKVGKELAKLPTTWHVLHAVQVSENGTDIDHVVIGPAGVFTLNTKRHPGGKVTIYERTIYVNGSQVPYLAKSRAEAQRTSKLLTAACGFTVEARSAIVFVDIVEIDEKGHPSGILVTTGRRLINLLLGLPVCLSRERIENIYRQACNSKTWLPAQS